MADSVDYKALKNGGFMRQKQKGKFSLRLKVVGGNLSCDQLSTITDAAKKYGNGTVHLTSRQGVELPFVKLADVEDIKDFLLKGGVVTGVCGPRVRTVTACQGDEICPSGCINTASLAVEISDRYFGRTLPHKFKFGVTGCQNNCLKAEENDVGIKGALVVNWSKDLCSMCGVCLKVCRSKALSANETEVLFDRDKCNYCGRCVKSCPTDAWSGESAFLVSFGGTFGNQIATGLEISSIVGDKETLFKLSDGALDFFEAFGRAGERFRVCIEREGWDSLKNFLKVKP